MFDTVCVVFAVSAILLMVVSIYDSIKEYKQAKEALARAKEYCPYNYNVRQIHESRLSLYKTKIFANTIILVLFIISIVIIGV